MEFILNPDGSVKPASEGETAAEAGTQQPGGAATTTLHVEPGADVATPAPADAGAVIKDSDTANFMADVIEASKQVPVIVDFWAPWCGPCKQLGPTIEKAVREAGGLVRLVKINVDENQELAMQMRIQSIPAVYAFKDGQPVDGFMGALPESQIKSFIDKLIGDAKPPLEDAMDQADAALEAGDAETAGQLYAQVQAQSPDNERAIAGMIRAAVAAGDTERAHAMAEGLPEAWKLKPEIAAALSALDLADNTEAVDDGEIEALAAKVKADEKDHQARFDLAMALYAAHRNEEAIDHLIELIRRDRNWNDEAARLQLLKIFDALGPTHPDTVSGRRRLSAVLFS